MVAESDNVVHGPKPLRPLKETSFGKVIFDNLSVNENKRDETLIDPLTKKTVTRQNLLETSTILAHNLRKSGYKKGSAFSICSENNVNYFYPIIASLYIGALIAPINPNYTQGELIHVFKIVKPSVIFCSKASVGKFLKLHLDFVQIIIVIDAEEIICQNRKVGGLQQFLSPTKDFDVKTFAPAKVDVEDVAFVMSSSGTTGLPKGVMITHKNLLTRHELRNDPRLGIFKEDFTLGFLPFFHSFGLFVTLFDILAGCCVVVLSRFEEGVFLRTIQDYKIKSLRLVPPLLVFLAKSPLVDQYDLGCIQTIYCGGAPLKKQTEEMVKRRFKDVTIVQGYGLTETTAGIIFTKIKDDASDKNRSSGTPGRLFPYVSAKVLDVETGRTLGPNQPGELCFKGDVVMKGYYNNEGATKETLDTEGWLHTGDIGYYDENENFYIVDRLKELIKYKGYQVAPAELEAILMEHPSIKDAGVVGLPEEQAGELPLAFVVKEQGALLTEKDVKDFVSERVSSPKRLRGGVHFVEAIPRNPSGKILRRELKVLLNKKMSSKL